METDRQLFQVKEYTVYKASIARSYRVPRSFGPAWTVRCIGSLVYKNAITYSLDVETFADANGDGIGDFEGLTGRLDYLSGLNVTCIWLQPFYRSPSA